MKKLFCSSRGVVSLLMVGALVACSQVAYRKEPLHRNLAEIVRPNPTLKHPGQSNWFLLKNLSEHPIKVWPKVGTDTLSLNGVEQPLTLPGRKPFYIWSVADAGNSSFLAAGWTDSYLQGVIARFEVFHNGTKLDVRCLEVLISGTNISGTSIIQTSSRFRGLAVIFDQAQSQLLYWDVGIANPRIVLTSEDAPGLLEMNFFFLTAASNHSDPGIPVLGLYFQNQVPRRRPDEMDSFPFGVLFDDWGDGSFEEISFFHVEGS